MAEYVANTSPLQYLHLIGAIDLLPQLYGRVVIPGAVEAELAAGRALGHDLPDPTTLPWVEIRRGLPVPPLVLAIRGLGAGEREVIALALSDPGNIVILDDLEARRAAGSFGITVTGTLGVLVAAKKAGHVERVRPLLNLLTDAGFRMGTAITAWVLEAAGEST